MPAERGRQMGQRIGGDTLLERKGGRGKLTKLKGIFSKQDHHNIIIDRKSWTSGGHLLDPCSLL